MASHAPRLPPNRRRYGNTAGGVAYMNAFGDPFFSPAFVFPKELGNSYPKYVWEAVSHEVRVIGRLVGCVQAWSLRIAP